jgi:hypothetical protein
MYVYGFCVSLRNTLSGTFLRIWTTNVSFTAKTASKTNLGIELAENGGLSLVGRWPSPR